MKLHWYNLKRKTLPQDVPRHHSVLSSSDRSQKTATHQWSWTQRPHEACSDDLSTCFFSGRGTPTSNFVSRRLSADLQWTQSLQIRPNCRTRWRLSVANNVWKGEDQNLGSQWTHNSTHCPDTRWEFPQEWLTCRWLKQLTRQAQEHLWIDPVTKLFDGSHHFSDLRLPRKLSERLLYPMCEKDPHFFALFFKLHAAAPMWFCPSDATRQNPSLRPIENGRLNMQQKKAQAIRRRYGTSGNTNQDVVTWPRYIHIDSVSRQIELRPQLVCKFTTSAQTQNFNQGGNFGHELKIGFHSTSLVDNDVFRKSVLPVSQHQRSSHDCVPLSSSSAGLMVLPC